MNKELFVSSTPHETKVGLLEDDLLAEVYLERENEYTLAGSIYKGRVTRVLPGMQSAFVDIGLERDAFLYVSDFMDLEEHDDELTDVIPASRGVQDLRPQTAAPTAAAPPASEETGEAGSGEAAASEAQQEVQFHEEHGSVTESPANEAQPPSPEPVPENGGDRERGWRGRRRRRGGRRDGRDRGLDRGGERDSRASRPAEPRPSARPPAGYQPILLPGESISKYQRWQQSATSTQSAEIPTQAGGEFTPDPAALAATFPDDEPIFASGEKISEPLAERHDEMRPAEPVESASTSTTWDRELRRPDEAEAAVLPWAAETPRAEPNEENQEKVHEEFAGQAPAVAEPNEPEPVPSRTDAPPRFAAPGTLEEETIDEEEAETIQYHASTDEGYDEFEEETQAAGEPEHLNDDAREAVSEIHMAAMVDTGEASAVEGAASEEDSEEFELEQAQAQAEAVLDAEARGNGTVDARAAVRAPSTAGYTQRSQRQRSGFDRAGYDRRGGRRGGRRFRRRESAPVPLISDLLKEGQEILVQIAKEPIGKKGARITSHIALPGRFLVYMPTVNHTGVSRKISSEEERQRLKRIILSERENGHGGFIVRTAAQSASEEELRADIRFLKGLWQDIKNRAESSKPPALIYHDLNVVERVLRDQVTADFNVIWVDSEPEYERILRFFNRFQPNMVKRVKLYTKETPLFEQFGLSEEMNKALKSKVWLKSGGYIVINQTEALVAIDINTGKYVGKTQRLEDTIVKTNVDAIKEIVRQIRLRDLGGIIIIDFIDMDERRNRQRVMQALEEELRHDRAPSKTLQFNDFGLVAITRKRVKQSLERTIGAPCPYCQSTGYVKSVTTICNEIYVEMRKIAKHLEHEDVMLRVHPDVAKELKSNNARLLNEMEEMTKRTIIVKSDPALHQEQFDIN
jgi:Rne/Rng family ribonuclease